MEFHEAANIFPLDEENLETLADDIRDHGLQTPIELMGGKIIDGRRRFSACRMAGIKPTYRDVNPSDPISYVLSLNLHRRHLTPGQRAMCAARAREVYDRQAKERQKGHGGTAPGKKKTLVENLPQVKEESGKSRDQVGKAFGVSGKSVDHATKIIENGTPELVKAVDEGRMSINTATILSAEPDEVQNEEATKPKRNRNYKSISGPVKTEEEEPDEPEEEKPNGKLKGKGVYLANEAINCLKRIPKNDALRKRGFQIVTDFIKANQ